jgi:hypothetical protein
MVAEVSFTFTFGFCILAGAPPHVHDHSQHADGTTSHYGINSTVVSAESERQALLAGMQSPTLKPLPALLVRWATLAFATSETRWTRGGHILWNKPTHLFVLMNSSL